MSDSVKFQCRNSDRPKISIVTDSDPLALQRKLCIEAFDGSKPERVFRNLCNGKKARFMVFNQVTDLKKLCACRLYLVAPSKQRDALRGHQKLDKKGEQAI